MIVSPTYRPMTFAAVAIALAAILSSCGITRTETDYYTITHHDTTSEAIRPNTPGSSEDNGVVFPSTRVTDVHRDLLQHDSTYDRKYPNFLRAGGLEFASFI